MTTRATVHNQHGQLVLDGEHTYLLKTAQQSTSEATSLSFTRVQDILGAWRLERAVEVVNDGERRDEFGPNPEGYLCYNPVGIVSATLGDSARPPVSAGDPQSGTDDDYENGQALHRLRRAVHRSTAPSADRMRLTVGMRTSQSDPVAVRFAVKEIKTKTAG